MAHLYKLRRSAGYRRQRGHIEPTRSTQIPSGQPRRPQPNGQTGLLRVDPVHQGDFDGIMGIYLNMVDAVTGPVSSPISPSTTRAGSAAATATKP